MENGFRGAWLQCGQGRLVRLTHFLAALYLLIALRVLRTVTPQIFVFFIFEPWAPSATEDSFGRGFLRQQRGLG